MITQSELYEALTYDPLTGVFRWASKVSKKTVVGREAGGFNSAGYVVISIRGQFAYGHRWAWFYMTGEWPARIDHKDGNPANNRWDNLRLATASQNGFNARRPVTNTSGYKGVSWSKAAGKWAAYYGANKYIGLFDAPDAAHAAYLSAVAAVQPDFVRAA